MEASEAASQSKKDALERARARVADRKRGIRSGVPSRANVEVEVDVLGLAGRAATAIASGSEQGTDHLQSAKSSRRSDLLSLMDDGRASKSNSNSTTSFKSEPKSEFLSPISPMTPFKSAPRRSSSALNLESARDLADVEFAKSRYKRMSISRASIGPKMDLDPAPPAGSRDLRASVGSLLSGTYQRKRSLKDDEKERAKREKDESNEVLHETTDDPDAIVQDDEAAGKKSKKKKNKKKKKSGEDSGDGESGDGERGKGDEQHEGETKKERKRRLKKEKKEKRRESSKSGEETGASDADKEDNEDPFDEFREATERAEREMISTYVERSKWESGFNPTGELITNLLFYPEKYVLPPSESLTALFESLRFPDQEGLYVGRFPTVKEENLTKLERRLRASNDNHGSDWFGPNQRLAALPLPNRERTQRPGAPPPLPVAQAAAVTDSMLSLSRSSVSLRFIEDPSPIVEDPYSYINNMGLVLRKPHPTSPFRHITTTPDGYYTLVFSLGSLNFTEHPLMTEECKLAKDVEEWIYALRARKKVDLVGFLSRKLEALKYSYAEYVDRTERILSSTNAIKPAAEVEPDGIYPAKPTGSKYYEKKILPLEEEEKERIRQQDMDRRREFREDIRSTRLLRDAEAHTDRLYEFKIIQAWERIKKLRKKTNLITSSVRVMVRAKSAPTSAEEDKAEFHRQVEEELQELEELHNAEMERKSRQYKVLLKEWRKRKDAEDELKRQKMSEDKETAKLSKRRNLLGVEADPLEDSDEDRVELVDDGRSGHEWLRESSESIRSKEVWDRKKEDKRARKLEKQAEREQENEAETPRKSIWDVFRGRSPVVKRPSLATREESSILDLTLDDSGISEPRSKSMRPQLTIRTSDLDSNLPPKRSASVKPVSSTKVDSAFAESSRKKTPVRKRERKEEAEEDTDIMASKSSLASQSSLRFGDDVRKWRSASRSRLDQPSPLKVRRPSSRAPSPGRVTPSTALPKSIVAQEQAPIKMRRKSAMLDAESVTTKSSSPKKPKSPKKKKKGIFGTADDMPVAPELDEFDANKARREIAKRLDASLRPPGAPILSISHVFSEHPTEFLQCPKDEQLRRREIESTNVFAIIYYNNKEVTRTMPQPIDMERFTIAFKGIETITIDESPLDSNEVRLDQANVFAVRVRERPDSIKIEFYEAGSYGNQYIGEVFVPIPDPSETVRQHDREFKSISFSGRPFFQRFTSSNAPHVTNKWIEGTIKLDVAWGVGDDGKPMGPPIKPYFPTAIQGNSKYTDPLCVSGAAGLLNLRKLMDWIMDVKFDPNDPRNSDVLRMKQLVQMGGGDGLSFHDYWSQRKYFRLHIPSRINQITLGVGLEYSTDTKRLTLLKKRHKKEVIVKVPVPFDDKDITDDIFEKVANPLEDDATALALWKPKTSKQSDDSSTSPSEHVGFLKRIRMHQLIQRARQGRPPRVEDYVREEKLAEVQIQENLLLSFFLPRRPLKPSRVSRFSRLTAQPEDGCKIVCQVLRGFNVPIRKQEYRGMMENDKERVTVRSYVEVSFQGRKTRTAIFDGPSPHWNETVSLDVIPPNNDFRPESIMDSEVGMERIYFNIFDELLIDIIDDDRVRDVEIHQRRERNWLGSFSMPFTALYEQTRIEGSFHVQIPTVLLGYEKNPSAGALDNSLFLALEATKETLVDVFITLEPPLLQPAPLKLRFLSDENDRFLRYATKWCAPLLLHPTRQFIATALDLSGRTTFICRYIRPQQPPEELLTPRHLLRYVSTIPYLPDRTAFSADVSLWATSDQMLELCAGDAAEHAILLCNYLLAKGGDNIEAYVVIGHGIPEGRTAYVAMRGKSATSANVEMTLMNAITGQSYSVRDPHLPLKVVGCVFNAENVWANIQAHDDPARIVWNISAPKLWKPFFCRSFPKIEYKSVQLEKLHYKEVSARYCQELEILIEKSIVAKVEEWRGHRITRWNRLASKSLKPLVSRLESDHLQPMPPNTPQHMTPLYQALAPLKNVYRISGFPLNTTFTDVKAVVELVGATDVHMNADPSAEFALSVWCGGYPGGFVSVWIYICSLTRGKGDLV